MKEGTMEDRMFYLVDENGFIDVDDVQLTREETQLLGII